MNDVTDLLVTTRQLSVFKALSTLNLSFAREHSSYEYRRQSRQDFYKDAKLLVTTLNHSNSHDPQDGGLMASGTISVFP
jgi:hypothetical protein